MSANPSKAIKGVHTGGAAWTQLHASIAAHALDLLVERGYDGFTVDALAASSGINRRTIYRHYPSLVDLAVAAIRQMPALATDLNRLGTPRDRILAAARESSLLPMRLPRLLATVITHAHSTPELLAAVQEHVLKPREAALAQGLEAGKAAGWARPDVQAWELSAFLNGQLINEYLGLVHFDTKAKRAQAIADGIWRLAAIDPDSDGSNSQARASS
ncbi:MAG: TetR/AcrR family transcriptional regulator [Actinomycetota bacterium]|nr:TetR/AcrR family transcriptional regulator [Actinomycetota bacterium]